MVTARVLRPGVFAAVFSLALWATAGQALELTSPDVANGAALKVAQVNLRCGGENRSPALAWSGAPKGTGSFAVTMFDSDANGGRGFWHWLVFNIPANVQRLPAGAGSESALPKGAVQAENDFGMPGYGGACPPPGSGSHHYTLTVYALVAPQLHLGNNVSASAVVTWLKGHALATATLTGTYSR
ncbi:MAG TPA: YbhB/YbcL family Raf kinase inhibitor-like protein [Rhizomicrobium sp.]|nr:YbhB/YbcL family Raf kinase inhibitor-like protein [Rhizomicrobium sp.]